VTRLWAERSGTKIPAKKIEFFCQEYPEWLWGSSILLFNGSWVSSLGEKWSGHEADHFHLVVRSRIRAAIPLLPIYVLMVMTGTTLLFSSLPTSLLLPKRRLCVLDYGICVSPNKLILLE